MYGQVNIVIQLCILLAKPTLGTELPLCNSKLNIQYDQCCLVKCINATAYNNTECNEECPSHMFEIDSNYCNISTAFTCITNCPDGYYGLPVNNTKVCLDCRLLCQVPRFKTFCSCRNQYSNTNNCEDTNILKIIIGILSTILVIVFVSAILGFCYQRRKDDKKVMNCLTEQGNGSQPPDKVLVEDVNLVANKHGRSNEDNNIGQTRNKKVSRYTKFRFGTNPVQSRNEKAIPNRRESNEYVNAEAIREHKKTFIDRISKTFNVKRMRKSTDCDKISTICSQNDVVKSTDIDILPKMENVCSENINDMTNKISSQSKTVLISNEHASTSHFSARSNMESKVQNTSTHCNTTNGQDIPIVATTMQLSSTPTHDIHENQAKEHKETLDRCCKKAELDSKPKLQETNDNTTSPYANCSSIARFKKGTVGNEQGSRLSVGSNSSKSSSSTDHRRSTESDHSSSYYSASESLHTENKENVLHKIEESSDYANTSSGILNINEENKTMNELTSFDNSNANIGVTHMAGLNISSKHVTVNIINNK